MNLKKISLAGLMAMAPLACFAGGMSDDPLVTMLKVDKLEWRDSDEGNLLVWELDAWIGKDLNKLWLKSSGESLDGDVQSNSVDLLYSRAISPFWDLQLGLRHEFKPEPSEDWVGLGFMGIAPYLFEVDANIFINQDRVLNARIAADYEYMLTQKVILIPNIDLSIYSDDDNARGIVSGLATAEIGLRLHYQIKREFSPYIGFNFEKRYGNSVIQGSSETQLVAGLSFWF